MKLEIGDFVYFLGEIVKVDMLSNSDVTLSVANENGSMCATYKNINPIPITSEILEKNGFQFNNRGAFVYNGIVKVYFFSNEIIDNTVIDDGDTYADIELKYVHELQHALRLCNIDKEIEL